MDFTGLFEMQGMLFTIIFDEDKWLYYDRKR